MPKIVLVTGGAGFIGSHLCDALIARGERIICIDNFSTGVAENIGHLGSNPDFVLIEHDLVEPLLISEKPDEIYHLACPASPKFYQLNPVRTMLTNVLGTVHALDIARTSGSKFLLASTSEIYGDPEEHPQRESYRGNVNPIGPRACYDEGKRCAEALVFDYHRLYGIPIKVARIFNTYGSRMRPDDGRVISNFILSALRGEALTIYGDGTQTRSFCYVDDLIRGMLAFMDTGPDVTGPINLGNHEEHSVIEIAQMIQTLVGVSNAFMFLPLPEDDPRRRRPDIGRVKEVLGWEPVVPLREGLEKTIAYFHQKVAM